MQQACELLILQMLNDGFCDPCKTLLRGESKQHSTHDRIERYLHHKDADSFEKALEVQCPLCVRLWGGMGHPSPLGSTTFEKPHQDMSLNNLFSMDFWGGLEELSAESEHVTPAKCTTLHFINQKGKQLNHPDQLELKEAIAMTPAYAQERLSPNTGSEAALAFFASKARECLTQHSRCRMLTQDNKYLPTRLVDVGQLGDDTVRLRNRDAIPLGSLYVALSHCWGAHQPVTLNADTEQNLRTGIEVEAFPKTFKDAFFVCQTNNIRFLWIDSL